MKVGVYLDGFNIYYGGRKQFGRGVEGWKWYSPRALAENALASAMEYFAQAPGNCVPEQWSSAVVNRVVFCSARIAPDRSQKSADEQNLYLQAIADGGYIDHLELGKYVARVKSAPLATLSGRTPQVVHTGQGAVKVLDGSGEKIEEGVFLVSYFHSEEKGSDVNLATHLMADVLQGVVDAAIVISNDTDLKLPVELAGRSVPVAVVGPFHGNVAGDLKAVAAWHYYLSQDIFLDSQMPDQVPKAVPTAQPFIEKPDGW